MRTEYLIQRGPFAASTDGMKILSEIQVGISEVVWPAGSNRFTIRPVRKGNGVKPIKDGFLRHLESMGWQTEERVRIGELATGPLDAVKTLSDGRKFAVEWETGNISSTHRAINKMALGMLRGELHGGAIVLPTRAMYHYLTDRIGNYEEIAPYFDVWRSWPHLQGLLAVIAIQHDDESAHAPPIPKGNDGWRNFSPEASTVQL
jgi:hypothetical protein